ncbi:MAG: AAA family ATPase [Chloroflexota bacterium]|nr:AAA family ATPase [Chloroflexota bacterium]
MHLTGIRLSNVPPFTDPITLRFDERVNVLIGPNASGKSTLLLALADHFLRSSKVLQGVVPWEGLIISEFPDDEFDEIVEEEPEANIISASEDWFGAKYGNFQPQMVPLVVYIGPVREGLSISLEPLKPAEYGETSTDALNGLFSGSRTNCAYILLGNELRELGEELKRNDEDSPYKKLVTLRDAEALAGACSKNICTEVIRDHKIERFIADRYALQLLRDPHGDVNEIATQGSMGIRTTDKPNFDNFSPLEQPDQLLYGNDENAIPIPISHLSSGTEGTLLWILWLALKLVHHYDFERPTENFDGFHVSYEGGWHEKPAILLIDEIENHLHPTWQRRVIPALLKHFPRLQIFATTHSPFVVAGLKAGQVHVLKRDENGVVSASTNEQDVVGWTMDEILRGMMGVEDPTDDETARAASELRQLRKKGPSGTPVEEEERQKRIQELRQKVDRDLLAGGPLAAQRELFEQQFAEALENYRRSQDLEQENH